VSFIRRFARELLSRIRNYVDTSRLVACGILSKPTPDCAAGCSS
jgi:hypothetical protein